MPRDQPTGALLHQAQTRALAIRDAATDRLLRAWLAGHRSDATRRAYDSDAREWISWLAAHDVDLLAARRVHVDVWARELEAARRAPSTVARKLAALASLYTYLVREDVIASSPVEHVRRPRVDDGSPRLGLEAHELHALVAAAQAHSPRSWALVILLGRLGLRVSEAIALDIADLGESRGHRTVRVLGKGGKSRLLPLPEPFAAAVDAAIGGRAEGPLLATANGDRWNRRAAGRTIARLARTAGIGRDVCPHDLRHAFVTLALDAGAPQHRVQDAAGHADPRTTRRYDRARGQLDGHAVYAVVATLA